MAEPPNLPRARHEHTDVTFRFGIAWFSGVGLVLGLVIGICMGLFRGALHEPLVPTPIPQYPAPTLQTSPRADLARFLREELRRLNSYGWVDRQRGIVHIPIEQAMRKVAREGIPGWPKPAPKEAAK